MRIVVKIGSSVIAPRGKINQKVIKNFAQDIAKLDDQGIKTTIVSSGAIACGINQLGYKKRPKELYSLMALASLGQVILMDVYARKFGIYRKICAQVLLTWDDFNERQRYLNARHTIDKLLALGVIPIINENDAVSYEEIKFGDNDRLSALVSDLVGAKLLIILSDVEGLIKDNEIVKVVEKIDTRILSLAKKEDSIFTTGGMVTKLEAAKIATRAGIKVVIANGNIKGVISQIVEGQNLGTIFLPHKEVEKAKKRWIAFSKKIKGKIYIDDGAKEAILYRGKSLLSCGVIKVEGDFSKRDAVEVLDSQGRIIGCGLVEYNSFELAEVRGKRYEREIIHRDNFVKREV